MAGRRERNADFPILADYTWIVVPDAPPCLARLLTAYSGDGAKPVKWNQRRTVYRVDADGETYFLKHMRADRPADRLRGRIRCNARLEFEAGRSLEQRGVPVVRHLAWGRRGPESIMITQGLPFPKDFGKYWPTASRDPEQRRDLLSALTHLLEAMAQAEVQHPDLHLNNVLIAVPPQGNPHAVLVDAKGVACGHQGNSAALSRLQLVALLRSQLQPREVRQLVRAASGCADQHTIDQLTHQAYLRTVARYRHRWKGIRQRHSRSSSVCEEQLAEEGNWLLCRPFPLHEAQQALAAHAGETGQDRDMLQTAVKRKVSRVRVASHEVIVKEFVCPRRFWRFRPDNRSWFAGHRLETSLVHAAACIAWLHHVDGRGLLILEDVGRRTLMDEMRESRDWRQRRRLLETAGRIIGLLHAARVTHGDLKPTNLVSSGEAPWLWLVDFDSLRYPFCPLSRKRKTKCMDQFFEDMHRYVTRPEALRFVAAYAFHAGISVREACHLMPNFTDWLRY